MTATNGSDYRTRFIREYRELDERIGNLAAMIPATKPARSTSPRTAPSNCSNANCTS